MSYYYSWNGRDAVAVTMDGAELFIKNCNSKKAPQNRETLLKALHDFKQMSKDTHMLGKREREDDDSDLDLDLKRLYSMIDMVKATDNDPVKLASLSNDVMAVNKRWKAMITSHTPEPSNALSIDPVPEPIPTPIQPRLLLQAPEILEKVKPKGAVVFRDSFVSALINACLNEHKAFAITEIVLELDDLFTHYKSMAKRDGVKVITTKQEVERVMTFWNSVNLFNYTKRYPPYIIRVVSLLKEMQELGKYDPEATLPGKLNV